MSQFLVLWPSRGQRRLALGPCLGHIWPGLCQRWDSSTELGAIRPAWARVWPKFGRNRPILGHVGLTSARPSRANFNRNRLTPSDVDRIRPTFGHIGQDVTNAGPDSASIGAEMGPALAKFGPDVTAIRRDQTMIARFWPEVAQIEFGRVVPILTRSRSRAVRT